MYSYDNGIFLGLLIIGGNQPKVEGKKKKNQMRIGKKTNGQLFLANTLAVRISAAGGVFIQVFDALLQTCFLHVQLSLLILQVSNICLEKFNLLKNFLRLAA